MRYAMKQGAEDASSARKAFIKFEVPARQELHDDGHEAGGGRSRVPARKAFINLSCQRLKIRRGATAPIFSTPTLQPARRC